MKLKRLLSGVTAAIMAFSAVAITSFTSVSASELADNAPIQWEGRWQKQQGLIDPGTAKGAVVQDREGSWQCYISEFDISGMENPTFEIEFEGDDTFQVAATDEDNAFYQFGTGKSGDSVLIPSIYRGDTAFNISTVANVGVITKISIYDDPNPPEQAIPFTSIAYNFTVIDGGNTTVTFTDDSKPPISASTEVTDSGDYTITRTFSVPQFSLNQLGIIEAEDPVTVTVNSIVINDTYTFEVNETLMNAGYDNALPNIYNDKGKASVIYTCDEAYIAGGSSITLWAGKPASPDDPGDEPVAPGPGNTDPKDGYTAFLGFADKDYGWDHREPDVKNLTYGGPIKGNGTYKLGIKGTSDIQSDWAIGLPANGVDCLWVDIMGYAKDVGADTIGSTGLTEIEQRAIARKAGVNVTNLSILADGKVIYTYNDADIMFGDIENKGNLRIDIYNVYNDSGNGLVGVQKNGKEYYEAPEELKDLLMKDIFEAKNTVEVQFTLTYKGSSVTPNTPAKPKTSSKADIAAAAKKAAQQAMKQAKITKLTAKAKGKKKINVTWKKAAKATGYEVQASTKKNFNKNVIKKTTTKNKLVIKKLKSKKKYFVRVRAYKTYKDAKGKTQKVYGKWFKSKKKVKVK